VQTPNSSDSCQGGPEALETPDKEETAMEDNEFESSKKKLLEAERLKGNPDPTTQHDEEHPNR
jgi:hypothetical protein